MSTSIDREVKVYKHQRLLNWGLLLVTFSLVALGLIMVYSATSVEAATSSMYNYDGCYYLMKQLRGVILGIICIFIIMKIRLEVIKKLAVPMVVIALICLCLVLVIGVERNGAKRWIEFAGFNFQPSELCKIGLTLFMASYLSESKKRIRSFWKGVLPLLVMTGVMFGLIELQPDLGTIIAIGLTFMFILFAAGVSVSHLLCIILPGFGLGTLMILDKPYRVARMMSFMNPWKDPEASGFHIIQSLLALGSGGIFGMGFGQSRQKLFYLPEHHTDFIFAVLGEELGFIGTAFTVILFLLFAYIGFKIALSRKDLFSFLLACGMTGNIVFQAFLNMGVASSMLPLTGVTLPFISFGSTSMMISLISVGVLLNISSAPPLVEKKKVIPVSDKKTRKLVSRKTTKLRSVRTIT